MIGSNNVLIVASEGQVDNTLSDVKTSRRDTRGLLVTVSGAKMLAEYFQHTSAPLIQAAVTAARHHGLQYSPNSGLNDFFGQCKCKCSPFPRLALDAEGTLVAINYFLSDGQTQVSAGFSLHWLVRQLLKAIGHL